MGLSATGRPGKLVMALPRELLTATPPSSALLGLGAKTVLNIEGEEKGLKLVFPPAFKARLQGPRLTHQARRLILSP